MLAPTLMIQGTASNVGKSLLVTGLCRYFNSLGLKVAPFKAQNMALNSYVTKEGDEIGRAQAIQADAARIPCHVAMNPVLLKPEGDSRCQVIVEGKALQGMEARQYHKMKPKIRSIVTKNLQWLRSSHDLVIIEGAGSPAEINLKQHDIVNMFVAQAARSPVLLAGDIDRGGVFASFIGTLELLTAEERELVAGFIINKFRGDPSLLVDCVEFLEQYTQKKCYGVVPMVPGLRLAEEDSLGLDRLPTNISYNPNKIDIAVVKLPRISNYDEFDSLAFIDDIHLSLTDSAEEILAADLLIIPGSKSTISDLQWLDRNHLIEAITSRIAANKPTIAICGGCQMLGQSISDPNLIESNTSRVAGIGILPFSTTMGSQKICSQSRAILQQPVFGLPAGAELQGYEIHLGDLTGTDWGIQIQERHGQSLPAPIGDGCIRENLLASLIHGLFDQSSFRTSVLNYLRQRKGLGLKSDTRDKDRDSEYDRLAKYLQESVDITGIHRLIRQQDSCRKVDL